MVSGASSKGTWDILSATTFLDTPQPPPSADESNGELILPGGFIIRKGEDPQQCDEEEPKLLVSHPRKRARIEELSKDRSESGSTGEPQGETHGGPRKRGRPKVEAGDETAAERRRTQIRLAQRAYRQRKETAISSLGGRVLELESTIERMNKTFLNFQSEALKSGVLASNPELAQQLRRATKEFFDLVNESSESSEHLTKADETSGTEDKSPDTS